MARRRNYKEEYRRRSERAHDLGFASEWERRRAPRNPRGIEAYARLGEGPRGSRSAALAVVYSARSKGTTIEEEAGAAGVPVSWVKYWARDALGRTRNGRTLPRAGDRLLRVRPLVLEGDDEVVFVGVRGSRASDRADRVWDLQWRVANDMADESELGVIRGMRIAGRTVETDPERLHYLARAQALDTDEVYRGLIG
jgi:hypothetical protein